MSFVRYMGKKGSGLPEEMRPGFGLAANYVRTAVTADAAATLTVAAIAGGLILRSGPTLARIDTSATAALILAAFPGMDVGDGVSVRYSNTSAATVTLAGGTGVTASGRLAVLTLTDREIVFFKTSATTMDMVAI